MKDVEKIPVRTRLFHDFKCREAGLSELGKVEV